VAAEVTMTEAETERHNARRTRAEIAAQTREAILNAACEVIAEIGLENIRMRMVAERAGVSTAALHYHFDTRENLFAAALHYSFGSTGADVYEAKGADDTATARLARIIGASLPMTASLRREWALWQELWCRAGRDEESRTLAVDLYQAHTSWIEETLDDGIASGEFRPCDTKAHAQLVNALCDGFGVQLMIKSPAVTLDSARATIWSLATQPLGVSVPFPRDGRR
jgi:AcrR family transcriptional regulator